MWRRGRHSWCPRPSRGVALILVLTTIAILTSLGVDFSYQSRVSLRLAENLRDETRAYYLARSAVNLSRLLLHFQKQVDQLGGQLTQGLSQLLGGGQAPLAQPAPTAVVPGQALTAAAPTSSLGIRLWEILPIDSNAFSGLLQGSVAGVQAAAGENAPIPVAPVPGQKALATHAFDGFDGSFHARIIDENSRINVQRLNGLQGAAYTTLVQLRAMMSDPKYDFIFNEEDANRDRVSRDDVELAAHPGVDATDEEVEPGRRGDMDQATVYADDPGAQERRGLLVGELARELVGKRLVHNGIRRVAAIVVPTVIPRSLKLPLGFSPSCLIKKSSSPSKAPICRCPARPPPQFSTPTG